MSDKTHMHDNGESYSVVVPAKQPNKSGQPPAEAVEGRTLTKENVGQSNPCWTPSQTSGPSGLDRVREAARRDGKLRFTALLQQGFEFPTLYTATRFGATQLVSVLSPKFVGKIV